jgi:hypothetical protein
MYIPVYDRYGAPNILLYSTEEFKNAKYVERNKLA